MYRYSRGQSGQGSLPRPAWGSGGAHGARASSPEPAGIASSGGTAASASAVLPTAGAGSGTEPSKERQDEVILQLETELMELRNMLAWKDQKIAELSRTDTPASRLKRDIRQLATELHNTRSQLSDSIKEVQDLNERLGRQEGRTVDVVESPSASSTQQAVTGDRSQQLRERINELSEENRQLREQLKVQSTRQNGVVALGGEGHDGLHHSRQPSGVSSQRASEPPQPHSASLPGATMPQGNYASGATAALRAPYLAGPSGAGVGTSTVQASGASGQVQAPSGPAQQEEPLRQIVYSSAQLEGVATIGPTMLQGVGTVDGVASVAKVLLQRIHSSVCSVHRRQSAMPGIPGQGPQPMVGMAPTL